MSEIITASIIDTPKPHDGASEDGNEYSIETLTRLTDHVMDFLRANNIDPASVLFAGFDASLQKEQSTEHQTDDGIPLYFFGDAHSLLHPHLLSDDPEQRSEHWMVNPLKFAAIHHSLGIYDKAALDTLTGGQFGDLDPTEQAEYGTYIYALDSKTLQQAMVAQLST
jgi:hypothetical protein